MLAAALLAGCGGDSGTPTTGPGQGVVEIPPAGPATPVERGRAIFARPTGGISCADCHSTAAEDQPFRDRRLPAHTLADATRRPAWWYGALDAAKGATVGDAALTCVARFQQRSWNTVLATKADGSRDLSAVEVPKEDLDALVAFLDSLARPGPHPALTAQRDASRDALARVDGLRGDAGRGRKVYRQACALRHGPRGEGDLGSKLKGDMQAPDRWRVIDYVRSGPTKADRESIDAWMPFFTPDILPDQDLSDVATLLESGDW